MDKADRSSTTVSGTNWRSTTPVWVCAALPHFLQPKTTRGQKQKPGVHQPFPADLSVLFKLAQNKSHRGGTGTYGTGLFCRALCARAFALRQKQSPTFPSWFGDAAAERRCRTKDVVCITVQWELSIAAGPHGTTAVLQLPAPILPRSGGPCKKQQAGRRV